MLTNAIVKLDKTPLASQIFAWSMRLCSHSLSWWCCYCWRWFAAGDDWASLPPAHLPFVHHQVVWLCFLQGLLSSVIAFIWIYLCRKFAFFSMMRGSCFPTQRKEKITMLRLSGSAGWFAKTKRNGLQKETKVTKGKRIIIMILCICKKCPKKRVIWFCYFETNR